MARLFETRGIGPSFGIDPRGQLVDIGGQRRNLNSGHGRRILGIARGQAFLRRAAPLGFECVERFKPFLRIEEIG